MLLFFGLLPERLEFLHAGLLRCPAGIAQLCFYPLEAPLELAIGFFQGGFGVKREIAGNVDQDEE